MARHDCGHADTWHLVLVYGSGDRAENAQRQRYPDARKGAFFCAALKITPVFIMVLPGLIAKTLWPTDVTGDNAYPLLVKRLMPPVYRD